MLRRNSDFMTSKPRLYSGQTLALLRLNSHRPQRHKKRHFIGAFYVDKFNLHGDFAAEALGHEMAHGLGVVGIVALEEHELGDGALTSPSPTTRPKKAVPRTAAWNS